MNTSEPRYWIVLDMDGVIFDSVALKDGALIEAFGDFRLAAEEIAMFLRKHAAQPRPWKVETLLMALYKRVPTRAEMEDRLERCGASIREAMRRVELMPGAASFVNNNQFRFAICSNAPADEIALHLADHDLTACFERVYGFPTRKVEALDEIVAAAGTTPVVYFGDMLADYEAALAADVAFVGVRSQGEEGLLLERMIPVIHDFSDQAVVLAAVRSAVALRAASTARMNRRTLSANR